MKIQDRFTWAGDFCEGKTVLDIGGSGAGDGEVDNPYYRALHAYQERCGEYTCADVKVEADIVVNLNTLYGVKMVLDEAKKREVVVLMEILEHIPLGGYLLYRLVRETSCDILVTLPANDNWVLNALRWDYDHVCGFTMDTAERFVGRACGGYRPFRYTPLIGKYTRAWQPVYWLSGGKPISHGFQITRLGK